MRAFLLTVLLLPLLAAAQPERDEEGISAAFADLVAFAHTGDVEAALPLTACPVEGPEGPRGRPVAGVCDTASAEHRARVEWQLALMHRLFPEAPTALRPHYNVEREGDSAFHLLLFRDLPAAPYALVSFIMHEREPLFGEVQVEDVPTDVPPPPSLVAALDALLAAAADPTMTPETFAAYVVARGDDPDRAWRTVTDPDRPDERAFAASALDELRRLMDESRGDYEAVGFDTDRESEGTWHVLTVRFDGHEEAQTVSVAFLPIGSGFLLGDLDG